MSTFDESQHPRAADGKFREKSEASAGVGLGAVRTVRHPRGGGRIEEWTVGGVRGRPGGEPALRIFDKHDKLESEHWYENGVEHRDSEPAVIRYFADGKVRCEEYHHHGALHRDFAPAMVTYDRRGNEEAAYYYQDGELHHVFGPAVKRFDGSGSREEFWVRGVNYSEDEFRQAASADMFANPPGR